MFDVGYEPAEVVEPVPRAFPFVHVPVLAIRQDRHGRLAVGRPANDSVLRSYFFTGRGFTEAKDIDIKVEHFIVVRYAQGEMADARKRPLDLRRVELVSGKAHGLTAWIGHLIVSMEQSAFFLADIGLRREIFETSFYLTDVFDGDSKMTDAPLPGAIPRLEDRDVVKAVGERDIAGGGATQLAHRKVSGVETRQDFRL